MLRCLLATLGKDAPGNNAVIRAGTRLALGRGMEVFGAKRGLLGILNQNFHKMRESDVGLILGRGGSLLGSSDFRIQPNDTGTLEKLALALKKFDLVVATGGLGSFAILNQVYESCDVGLTTTMFVPASVENEFLNPQKSSGEAGVHAEAVGADTAANTAIESIDRLREQSYLSRTVFLIECIGAKSNFLPIHIGLSCGAHRIYLPKFPVLSPAAKKEIQSLFGEGFDPNYVNTQELVKWVEGMFEDSRRTYLVVIIPNGIPLITMASYRVSEESLGLDYESIVTSMAPLELTVLRLVDDLILHFSGAGTVQVRYVVLDDLQRGGEPTARDRILGSLYGEAAIEEFLSLIHEQDVAKRGNLNLLAIDNTTTVRWRSFRRDEVVPMFQGANPRAGGLDPLPFFRQSRGTVSGYRPLAALS